MFFVCTFFYVAKHIFCIVYSFKQIGKIHKTNRNKLTLPFCHKFADRQQIERIDCEHKFSFQNGAQVEQFCHILLVEHSAVMPHIA